MLLLLGKSCVLLCCCIARLFSNGVILFSAELSIAAWFLDEPISSLANEPVSLGKSIGFSFDLCLINLFLLKILNWVPSVDYRFILGRENMSFSH